MLSSAGLVAATVTFALLAGCADTEREPRRWTIATAEPSPSRATRPSFTFVSMPDFLNYDVADMRSQPGWRPSLGNGTNRRWSRAIATVLDGVAAEDPDAVLVAGDLVAGYWGLDADGSGLFGPTTTTKRRLAAVDAAGRLYYQAWAQRFTRRHLTVYPAVGDHDLGDNPWPSGSFDYRAVPTFRKAFARQFTRTSIGLPRFTSRPVGTQHANTAYAIRLPGFLLVTVDVFQRRGGQVTATVTDGQLAWLDRVLGKAERNGVEHIVVQGHTPILGPVRSDHSSDLMLVGGRGSPLWQTLSRHHVDLYLCGEVHDMTTLTADGVVQISHGALLAHGSVNYLVGQVYRHRIVLTLKVYRGHARWATGGRLWATTEKRPTRRVWLPRNPRIVGRATLVTSPAGARLRAATGRLAP